MARRRRTRLEMKPETSRTPIIRPKTPNNKFAWELIAANPMNIIMEQNTRPVIEKSREGLRRTGVWAKLGRGAGMLGDSARGGDLLHDLGEDSAGGVGVAVVEVGLGDDAVGADGDDEVLDVVGGDEVAA